MNVRNYLELARLEPGVESNEGRAFDPAKPCYTGVSIGGRQGREMRITIDGIDAVDEHVGTTKRGTNFQHGPAFAYGRGSNMAARTNVRRSI